jgi:N-acetylmuramoyl-L-alanine amidase
MPNIINSIHKYRPRGAWGQRPVGNIQKLVVHHSAAEASDNPEARLTQIMGWHLANSSAWMGLSYHYVITKNGNIYQTNKHEDLTWHDGVNRNSLGILVDGYFHAPNNNQPTSQQLESLEWLLTELATKHPEFSAGNNPLQDIVGHRDVSATACPGDLLYSKLVEIKQRINQNIKNPQPAKTPIAEIPKIREPKKKLENTYYQNAYDQKDIDWIIGSLLDRDNEVAKLKAEVENWKNQVQKSPVKDTTQIKNLLNQIQNLI